MSKFVSIQAGNHRYRIAVAAITKFELVPNGSILLSATHGRDAESYRVPPDKVAEFLDGVDPDFPAGFLPATDNPGIPPALEAT